MKEIHQIHKIKATTEEIYTALTNPLTIELWTGFPAVMSNLAGTQFEMWDGDICGENIEFIENKKIVQEWYFGNQPDKSIVTINLRMKGDSTIFELSHTNIPDEAFDEIKKGWYEAYIKGLQLFFK